MPLHEIRDKFTLSEIVITSWRSQEMSYNMSKSTTPSKTRQTEDVEEHNERLGELPSTFYNEEGELDLRKVPGPVAYKFFQNMGIQLPIIQR